MCSFSPLAASDFIPVRETQTWKSFKTGSRQGEIPPRFRQSTAHSTPHTASDIQDVLLGLSDGAHHPARPRTLVNIGDTSARRAHRFYMVAMKRSLAEISQAPTTDLSKTERRRYSYINVHDTPSYLNRWLEMIAGREVQSFLDPSAI